MVTASLLYAYSWLQISNSDGFLKFWENEDYILYSKISKYIASTGHENESNVLNLMDNYYIGSGPYHYFDLWGGACVSNIFGLNHYISLKLIIYPTFFFLYAVGIFALFNKNNLMSYVLAFGLLLVGGITYQFNTNINFLNNLDNISFNLLNPVFLKLSFFYVFIISAYLLYKNNLFSLAFLCMLTLPVANIITLPTIFPALFLILMTGYFNKTIDKSIALKCLIYLVVSFISIVLFYVLFKRQTSGLAGVDPTSPMKIINENLQLINYKRQEIL